MHNHILPGIDDGAKTVEESMALIKGFASFGVTNFVASPHIMSGYYPNTPKTINTALQTLKEALVQDGMEDISVDASAEHMIDDNFEHLLESDNIMVLRKEYVLIEMSFLQQPFNFDAALIGISNKSLYPVLAHPERYNFLRQKPKKFEQYKQMGMLFQLNILSLGGYYGKSVQKTAHKLLEDGHVDFIGSDVHHMNQLNKLKDLTVSQKTIKSLLPIITDTIETFY